MLGMRTRFVALSAVAVVVAAALPVHPASAAVLVGRSNDTAIVINNPVPPAESQPASVYPSTIAITGASLPIERVEVVIPDLSHGAPVDIRMTVVGPTGVAVVLMGNIGGFDDVQNVSVRFADGATPIPNQNGVFGGGTWAPSGNVAVPQPPPAPPDPATYQPNLAAFNGTNPVGTWSLFVSDHHRTEPPGVMAQGWRLELTLPSDACLDPPEDGFTDVEAANVHEGAIDCLVAFDVAAGTSATTFNPSGNVSRAQMASFVARAIEAAGTTLNATPPDAFDDDQGNTHELRINQLAAAGVIGGNGEQGRTYLPGGDMRRDHMASYMSEAFEAATGTPLAAGPDAFGDDTANPHEAAINALAARGVISGTGQGTFNPEGTVSRAQMGSFLARFVMVLDEAGALD